MPYCFQRRSTSTCALPGFPEKTDLYKPFKSICCTGHIGFLGRSGVFLFVGILMFRTIANPNLSSTDETTIGNALSQLQKTHAGRACLFILGFFLIVYGTFAVRLQSIMLPGQQSKHTEYPSTVIRACTLFPNVQGRISQPSTLASLRALCAPFAHLHRTRRYWR